MLKVAIAPESLRGRADTDVTLPDGHAEVAFEPFEELQSIGVFGGADVETLDLSALPASLTLYLRGLPKLRRLVLPARGGAFLHLDLPQAPALRIDGPIERVDACWPGGMLHSSWYEWATHARPPILQGAWLGRAAAAPTDVELLAICDDDSTQLDLSHHTALCVVVERSTTLERLAVGSHALLYVRRATALRELHGGTITSCCIGDARPLASIRASGIQLTIRDGARVDLLEIEGRWEQLALHRDGPIRLIAPGVRTLTCEFIHRLLETQLAPSEAADSDVPPPEPSVEYQFELLLHELGQGEKLTRLRKNAFVALAKKLGAQRGLEALAALAKGSPLARPADLWTLRMGIARSNRRRGTKGTTPWQWEFPADLADRGWRADVQLWQHCAKTTLAAQEYEAFLRVGADPDHLAAIADEAHDLPAPAANTAGAPMYRVDLLAILGAQLAAGLEQGPYYSNRVETTQARRARSTTQLHMLASPSVIQALKVVLRAFVRLRHRPEVPALVDALIAWMLVRCANGSGIRVLAAMHELGAPKAAAALAALVANEKLNAAQQHEALMATLVKPRHSFLAFPERAPDGR